MKPRTARKRLPGARKGSSKSLRARTKRTPGQLTVRERRRQLRGLARAIVERAKDWHWTRREEWRRRLAGKRPLKLTKRVKTWPGRRTGSRTQS